MSSTLAPRRSLFRRKSTRIVLGLLVVGLLAFWFAGPAPTPPLRSSGQHMKAIVYHEYGSPDVLRFEDVDKPLPNDNQVLIKVRAAAANPLDWHFIRGTPYLVRTESGFRKPKDIRTGADVSGIIESVGRNVTKFKPGDEVFGTSGGAFAEYAPAGETKIVLKPAHLTFEQAAAVPIAALTALQALRDKGHIKPGQKVLINGASGGVGTFAVQIAKLFGAEVTGVCSTRNLELVRSLGADHVIDYTREDFTKGSQKYDLILDNVGNHSLLTYRRVMNEKATLVMVGGGGPDGGRWLGPMAGPIKATFLSPFVSQEFVMVLATINQADLTVLQEMLESRKITPVIDKSYPLSEVPAAIRYLEGGHARGKVVITVTQPVGAPTLQQP